MSSGAGEAKSSGPRIVPEFLVEIFSRKNRFVTGIALLAALGGMLFGFDTGVVSGALPYIAKTFHLSSLGQSWVVGSLLLGAVVGALISGKLADSLSRKWTKFLAGCLFTCAGLWSALSPDFASLIASRVVLGLAVGTSSFVAPLYIAEHSPRRLRGGMTALNQFAGITLGILLAYVADFGLVGFSNNWRWMFGFEAIPGIALAVAMVFVPHTPRWLVQKSRTDEAADVLAHTRPGVDPSDEVHEIEHVASSQHAFHLRQLLSPKMRMLLVVGVGMAIFQQVLGINTVIYFGTTILHVTGLNLSTSVAETVFIGVVNFVFAGVAVFLIDKVGRKPLLVISAVGCTLTLIVLGIYFDQGAAFQHVNADLALAALLGYLAFFEIGLGPVFWVMIAEIYPLRSRPKAMAVATMFNWGFNFLVSFYFLQMTSLMGKAGTFWLYAGLGVCAAVFFAWFVPETRNRSLEEIERQVTGQATEKDVPTAA
ncbi:MAG: sugar porter family MFS transporter [Acidimicrobiales bacterium]